MRTSTLAASVAATTGVIIPLGLSTPYIVKAVDALQHGTSLLRVAIWLVKVTTLIWQQSLVRQSVTVACIAMIVAAVAHCFFEYER